MEADILEWPKRKERKERKEKILKKAKVKGEEHVSTAGKTIPERQTGPDCR